MNPADLLVLVLIAAVLLLLVWKVVKKLSARETCCGTQKENRKKKRLKNPIGSMTFRVSGMKCANCAARITKAINDLQGYSAKADLRAGKVTVFYDHPVDEALLCSTIESLGYPVHKR